MDRTYSLYDIEPTLGSIFMRLIPKSILAVSILHLSWFSYAATPVEQAQFLDANQETVTLLTENDGGLVVMRGDGSVLHNQAAIDWLKTVGISLTISSDGKITPVELTLGAKALSAVKPASSTVIETLKKAQQENVQDQDQALPNVGVPVLPSNQATSSGYVGHHFSSSTGSTVTAPNISK